MATAAANLYMPRMSHHRHVLVSGGETRTLQNGPYSVWGRPTDGLSSRTLFAVVLDGMPTLPARGRLDVTTAGVA